MVEKIQREYSRTWNQIKSKDQIACFKGDHQLKKV